MFVKFKGIPDTYKCTEPIEQKIFRAGEPIVWAIMFQLHGVVDSSEIDRIITPESISELTFINNDEQQTTFAITGYSAITACTIRHRTETVITELQFTKASKKDEVADEGVTGDEN